MRRSTLFIAVVVVGATTAPAHAQLRESRDFPIERFRLALSRAGVLGAESGQLAAAGSWELGLWLGTAKDPLVLSRLEENGARTELQALVARRTAAAFALTYGRARWELGLEVPLVLSQSRGDMPPSVEGMLASISGAGLGDVRLVPKLALLTSARHGVDVAILASLTIPTGGGDDYRGEGNLSLAPELAVSRGGGGWRGAVNLGYRARANTELLDLEVGDELFGAVAVARQLGEQVEGAAGFSWATAALSPLSSDNQDHAELQLGLTVETGPLALSAIGGAGLSRGFGTPDWRAVLAARFLQSASPKSARDSDGDGVEDARDRCSASPEDRDGWKDEDGCPDDDNDDDGVLDRVDRQPLVPEDRDGWQDGDGAPDDDNDGDGIADAADQCPRDPETVNQWRDEDGCPDAPDPDTDGIADPLDACPTAPEDKDGWKDEDGCPDEDNDGDGINDDRDRCPAIHGVSQLAGCPDPDRDGDGLVDRLDNCPDTRGTLAHQGCTAPQLVRLTDQQLEILDIVYFETNRDRILPRSFLLLNNVASVLLAHPELASVRVEGHTDSQGDESSNLGLSRRRASAVARYLIARGVPAERLTAEGFGESRPLVDNATAAGRARNRRVEFHLGEAGARRTVVDFPDEVIEYETPKPPSK